MPFGFLKRKEPPAPAPSAEVAAADVRGPRAVPFEGVTEDWRLRGTISLGGRMSDSLNRREPLEVTGVEWAPADGSGDWAPAPGIRSLDPYDLILVIVTPDSLPLMSEDEQRAHRIHKIPFDVAIEAPPYQVVGTIHLRPGNDPDTLLEHASQMFYALTDPDVRLGDALIPLGEQVDAVLVNRFYVRSIDEVDRRTGERAAPIPAVGSPSPAQPG